MPFNDNLPASGTKPWYTPFNTAWTNLKAFVNGLETDIANIQLEPGPKGDPGDNGADATITGVSASGLPAGASPTVTMGGTPSARTFAFGIPKGDKGDPGDGSGGGSVAWVDVTGKPSEFAPSPHTHVISDITGLQAELDGKALSADVIEFVDIINGTITDLSTEVGTKAAQSSVDALSNAQTVMAGNLDSTFQLASDAEADAASALAGLAAKANTSDVVPNTRTVAGKALSANITLAKADVGLPNVDNTSDAGKPVSTAQQAALDLKLNVADVAGLNTLGWGRTYYISNSAPDPTGLPDYTEVIRMP